jgi:Methyltransferase domain
MANIIGTNDSETLPGTPDPDTIQGLGGGDVAEGCCRMCEWDKTDIVHFLSDRHGHRSYLEICTPVSGGLYGKIDKSRFTRTHRLLYRCPPSYDDGMEVNFRSADMLTADLFETIRALSLRYDVILVDPFHTYDATYRDLVEALSVMTDRGSVVVHDCYPPSEHLVARDWSRAAWCGVTFMAYIDFLRHNPELTYATVDTDYGCGVFRKDGMRPKVPGAVADGWDAVRGDEKAAYRFMRNNAGSLLNLVSVDAFKAAELSRQPVR